MRKKTYFVAISAENRPFPLFFCTTTLLARVAKRWILARMRLWVLFFFPFSHRTTMLSYLQRYLLPPIFAIAIVLFCSSTPLFGQKWANDLFYNRTHNFGTVAKNAPTEYRFELTNIYNEDVHIASVSSTCSCTTPLIEKKLLKTYEKGAIIARVNTERFSGSKGAKLIVTIDKPFYARVELQTSVYIRSDIAFSPGKCEFGAVPEGIKTTKRIGMSYYGSDSSWQITRIVPTSKQISATAIRRGWHNGRTRYDIDVRVAANAPPGRFSEYLNIYVSGSSKPLPLRVMGEVNSGATVSPTAIILGEVKSGEKISKTVVVKADTPFTIELIRCDLSNFTASTNTSAAKKVHLVTFEYLATSGEIGEQGSIVSIRTSLGEKEPEFTIHGSIK